VKAPHRAVLGAGAALVALGACAPGGASSTGERGESLTVYAAASLQGAFDELLEEFAREVPSVTINPAIYDGSSTLVTQIQEGASADVLATANEPTMTGAVDAGVTTSEPQVFASNDLVIAVPQGNPLNVETLTDVTDLDYAVCAPQVPCGDATAQLFASADVPLSPITEEQSVTSVANRVSEGDVDAGFVYSTDVAARPGLIGISPQEAQIVNHYPIAATSMAPAGEQFVEFVLSVAGQEVLRSYGFGRP